MNSWSCTPSINQTRPCSRWLSGHSGVWIERTFNFTEPEMLAQFPSVRNVFLETESCRNSEHEYLPPAGLLTYE